MENIHHHGLVMKKYRERKGLTQRQLGERWPTGPVLYTYIQKVETGNKRIVDQNTLRQISMILDIPLWEFGLSEYNPFVLDDVPGQGNHMFSETLDVIEHLIKQTWFMRRVAPVPETERTANRLITMFEFLRKNTPPPTQLEKRFLVLFAQTKRLSAIMKIERRQYFDALQEFLEMSKIAKESGDASTIALALMGIGTELERQGDAKTGVDYLEEARDISFNGSRQVAALVNAYLARVAASNGNANRFRRAIDTAENIALNLGSAYGDGTDYVFHKLSGIFAERSYGSLEIGEPQIALALKDTISQHIAINENTWLHAWIPLDWARAHLQLNEIDECVKWGLEFYHRAKLLQSPHALSSANKLLIALESQPGNKTTSIQAFRETITIKD